MSNNIENIGNQYTSEKNKKKQRHQMKMRVVKKRIALFAGIMLAIIIVLSIMLVAQKHRNDTDTQERKHKEEQFQKQQNEEIALKEQLNNLNDKDYIEKIARDDYYLSNKGEVIFKLPGDKKTSSSNSSNN
ncbi:septum formation initiator family protein [Staphylococcus simiae]|uniref:cell division protein DivIC n=1 Tax=Staphylococcus simiae TaxID=308354 RepID=UPI001A959549|nr:septum formation initiator family protein [Staphylococcus simiae]MBO1199520.1 septum formation initiator family protein [Staphylococcus simiae]MBO1201817.1 septum formation initiator family protein [Staphylococcus simiae]MBO1204271.1 septum formation initiator family protein [Staphylococcus simiae]MBO1211537.1 septum formation initiator family protein [Staphylococcus simiae]MBO1230264.1 septum formation initiator family protein [Staphylococcus simiae]